MRLWAYRTKSAQIHLGIRNGEPVPGNVRMLLVHNGFTLPPPEESKEGEASWS